MGSSRLVQIIAILLVPAFLLVPVFLTKPLNEQREWVQVFGGAEAALPPEMVVPSVALATFRGLAIDMLWHRADKMQQEGKFYDADTLSEWITNLQPRFPEVWRFRAWNMAFNISVVTHTPQERWDWVKKGVELLRDKGIPANPQAPQLYQELNWLFFFKIGGNTDDMNWYYKRAMAREWQEMLGEQAVGATTKQVVEEFRKVAEAPSTLEALLAEQPKVQKVLDRLKAATFEPDVKMLRAVGVLRMSEMSPVATMLGRGPADIRDPRARALAELMVDKELAPEFEQLINFVRKHTIIHVYHMEPARMLSLMEEFGPLDWRHPGSHSLYWVSKGIEASRIKAGERDIQMLNVYRGAIHSLQMLSYEGRVFFDPLTNEMDTMPDPRFFPAYEKAMNQTLEYMRTVEGWDRSTGSFQSGHENFLVNLCLFSYFYGDEEEAVRYYNEAREKYSYNTHPSRAQSYKEGFETFIKNEAKELLTNEQNARQYIDALFVQGYTRGLAVGSYGVYERFRNMARVAHIDWTNGRKANEQTPPEERLMLLPFDQIEVVSLINYMRNPRADILMRYRIWSNTPTDLQWKSYDQIKPYVEMQTREMGVDVDKLLPEPVGMEAYRKANPQVLPPSALEQVRRVEGQGAEMMRQ